MTLEEWGQIGDLVGGVSTFLGLLFAVVTVNQWRTVKRWEHRSRAASSVLSSVMDVHSAVIRWITDFGFPVMAFSSDPPDQVLATVKNARQEGRPLVARKVELLAETLRSAAPHLTHTEIQSARQVEAVFRLYSLKTGSPLLFTHGDPAVNLRKILGLANEFLREASEAEQGAHAVLAPIARLEHQPLFRRVADALAAWQKKQEERGLI